MSLGLPPIAGRVGNAKRARTRPANVGLGGLPALVQSPSSEGSLRSSQSAAVLSPGQKDLCFRTRSRNAKTLPKREPQKNFKGIKQNLVDFRSVANLLQNPSNIEDVWKRSASMPEIASRRMPCSNDLDFPVQKTEAKWANDLLASLPKLRERAQMLPSLKASPSRGEASCDVASLPKLRGRTQVFPSFKASPSGGEPSCDAGAGEAVVVRKGPASEASTRSAQSIESANSVTSVQASTEPTSSPVRGVSKQRRGPLCLADAAHRWDLSLDILKEGSELFKQHAALPGFADDEDILRDGLLDADGLIKIAMTVTKVNSAHDLPSELCRKELVRFVDKDHGGRANFQAFACWYREHSFKEYINLSESAIRLRDFGHTLGLSCAEIEHYKAIFDKYDDDRSGHIDQDEFARLMKCLTKTPKHLEIPANRMKRFWTECDRDGNGLIDLEEFIIFYMAHFNSEVGEPISDFYKGFRRTSTCNGHLS